jgi:predicted ATPase/DNA-binding SARP family transcriptional activator
MEFRILGPLEVVSEQTLLDLGAPRVRLLLALLLVRGGEVVSTDRLIEDLWDGDPPATSRHTMQGCVYRLRQALGVDAWRLATRPPGYQLKASADEVDARRFQELAQQGRDALAGGRPELAAGLLQEALALWRGSALADLPDASALEGERARLEGMRLTVLEDRVEADLAVGRHAALAAELERLVAEHPFRERLWGQLMVALYRAGRQAEALQAFRRAREILGEELGLEPSPWLTRLQEQVLLHDPALGQPQAAGPVRPAHNLPVQPTSFVGRRRELAEVAGLLATRRLVTLTGPPGSGKTRLAIEAATRSLQDHPHGVVFVALAELQDPDLVAAAVAAALGVSAPDRPTLAALVDHLKPRRLLLVLDNCEHLLPAAPLVTQLLDTAPGLRVLATSRAPLRLSGEQEYGLAGLPVPDPTTLESDDPTGFDVLALFADRARAIDPRFALTGDNAAAAAQVAARVDGLPLAVELAAARLRLFPLGELHHRLERVLPLLTEGPRDRPRRQQTLRDAIAWSEDLLDPAQRALFRRLGVFRGGCTLEAAEAVAGDRPVQDVLAGIAGLVEASLLQRPAEGGPVRYAMLETIREYALDQLRAGGEEPQIARRHADFYANLAAQAEPELTRAKQAEWLGRLAAEHANLQAVLGWATQTGDTELGLLLAARLWRYWALRGHFAEGRRWLQELLALADAAVTVPRVRALIGLAGLCYWQGDLDCAETRYREAVAASEDLGDWWLQFEALAGLVSTIACHRGEPEEAAPFEQQLQALVAQRPQDPLAVGFGMAITALVRLFTGDLEGSRHYNQQVLAGTRALGERWYEGETLATLGLTSLLQQRYEQAEEELTGALEIAWEAGDLAGVAYALDRLGQAAVALGRPARGITLAGAASRLREAVGGGLTVEQLRWKLEDPREGARRVLTEAEVDVAWAQGRVMTPAQAVVHAKEPALEPPQPTM